MLFTVATWAPHEIVSRLYQSVWWNNFNLHTFRPFYTNSAKLTKGPSQNIRHNINIWYFSLYQVFNSIIFQTLKKKCPEINKSWKKPFKEAFKYWKLFRLVESQMSPIRKTYQNTNNLTYHMDHSQPDSVFCKVHALLIFWMDLTHNLFLCQRWQFLHQFQKLLQKPRVLNHSDRIAQPKGGATEKLIH